MHWLLLVQVIPGPFRIVEDWQTPVSPVVQVGPLGHLHVEPLAQVTVLLQEPPASPAECATTPAAAAAELPKTTGAPAVAPMTGTSAATPSAHRHLPKGEQ